MNPKMMQDQEQARKNARIERLHRKFDPPEKFPVDPEDAGPERSEKQPGQELRDPQSDDEDAKSSGGPG